MTTAVKTQWAVFPCRPRGKEPWGKYAPHGHNSASADEGIWSDVPVSANWGINCAKSGLVVIDIDGGEIPNYCPPTYTVKTGRGWHLYYLAEPGDTYVGKLGEQIDVKHNGYVIAAGGTHPDGHLYELKDGREPVALSKKLKDLLTNGRAIVDDARSRGVSRGGSKHNLGVQKPGSNAPTGSAVRKNAVVDPDNNQGVEQGTKPTYEELRDLANSRYTMIVKSPGGKKLHIASKALGREHAYTLCGPIIIDYTVISDNTGDSIEELREWAFTQYNDQLCTSCKKQWTW